MIPLPSFKGLFSSGGFDPDYQAVLSRATSLGYTLPDAPTQAAGNALVVGLKAAGIWSKLDVLYLFATTGDQNFATLNWKAPTLYQATLVSSPTFRSKGGFKGDGLASYINTNFNPATNGVQYTQNNASRAAYITTPATGLNAALAIDGNSSASVNTSRNAALVTQRINSTTNLTTAHDVQGAGLKTINRTDANTLVNTTGTTLVSQTSASQVISSLVQWIFRSTTTYGDMEIGMYAMGSELTSVYSAFNNAMNNYMRAMTTGFDSDYQAIINRAVALGYNLPSAYCQYVQNEKVLRLKSLGVWSKLDVLYSMDNDCTDANFATLNWKSPSNFQLTLVNSPTWTQYEGISLDGNTQYMNTNWTPSVNAVNYTQDNCTVFYRQENAVGGVSSIGTVNGVTGLLHIITSNGTGNFINSTNSLNTTPGSSSLNLGKGYVRQDATNLFYKAISATVALTAKALTETSTGLPNTNIFIGRSGTSYGGGVFKYCFFGSALTDAELYGAQAALMSFYGVK